MYETEKKHHYFFHYSPLGRDISVECLPQQPIINYLLYTTDDKMTAGSGKKCWEIQMGSEDHELEDNILQKKKAFLFVFQILYLLLSSASCKLTEAWARVLTFTEIFPLLSLYFWSLLNVECVWAEFSQALLLVSSNTPEARLRYTFGLSYAMN